MSELITVVRDLHRRRAREKRGLTILEGVRLVEEALAADVKLRGAVVDDRATREARFVALIGRLEHAHVPCEAVRASDLGKLALTESPPGILAVAEIRRAKLAEIRFEGNRVALALDGVQDPGNVGALVRTAAGLEGEGVVCLPGTADPWNPKALRGSMGATFRLPVVSASADEVEGWMRAVGVELWIAAPDGEDVRTAGRPRRLLLAVGNEGAGSSPAVDRLAHRRVGIRMAPNLDSLNVGVAAGIMLWEVLNR